jgi:hypothetical protein
MDVLESLPNKEGKFEMILIFCIKTLLKEEKEGEEREGK